MKRVTTCLFLVVISLLFVAGCSAYSDMTGTVVDAETGKPIEGAVVLVEWTKTKGIGLTNTEAYKVQEIITDKDGKFEVSGVSVPLVNAPRLTIYKKNYVAWNNEIIFPKRDKRNDFMWGKYTGIKMIPFTGDFSRAEHISFLHSVTHWGKIMNNAYRWEEIEKEPAK